MFWFRFDGDAEDGWSIEEAHGPRRAPSPRTSTNATATVQQATRTVDRTRAHTSIALARLRVGAGTRARAITIEYVVGPDAGAGSVSVVLTLHDARGRIVRTLKNRKGASGAGRVSWDGTDAFGSPVEPGLYYARLRAGGVVRLSSVWMP